MSTLSDLPPAVPGKSGWPWTEAPEPLPPHMPDGSPWPKISIVTPSYNQALYIEETIRSVLLQNYPHLEYFIIDGRSTDGSVEIIKKYEPWLTYWESVSDRGQPHAINKGFALSTGEIMAWINSDDYYEPGAFKTVALAFRNNPSILWAAGKTDFIKDGVCTNGWGKPQEELERWFVGPAVMQQGVFWKRQLWDQTHRIDECLQYSFDYDLWFQFVIHQRFPLWVSDRVANFRLHAESKTLTSQDQFHFEFDIIRKRYLYLVPRFSQRLRITMLQKEHKAIKHIGRSSKANYQKRIMAILTALWICPWFFFKRKFYWKLKALILE